MKTSRWRAALRSKQINKHISLYTLPEGKQKNIFPQGYNCMLNILTFTTYDVSSNKKYISQKNILAVLFFSLSLSSMLFLHSLWSRCLIIRTTHPPLDYGTFLL